MNRVIIFCILSYTLLFSIPIQSYSQHKIEPELLNLFHQIEPTEQKYSKPLKEASNEFEILVSTGFLIYKKVISSQDKPSCVFTPSCSEYAVESFQKKGMITGWLQAFDRLSRCHGFVNHSHYSFDKEKNRFYDPVQ